MMKLLVGLSVAAAAAMSMEATTSEGDSKRQIAPARDGNIAIQQELDEARKAANVEAYDLFISRHPGHPLERVAREERARLLQRR